MSNLIGKKEKIELTIEKHKDQHILVEIPVFNCEYPEIRCPM